MISVPRRGEKSRIPGMQAAREPKTGGSGCGCCETVSRTHGTSSDLFPRSLSNLFPMLSAGTCKVSVACSWLAANHSGVQRLRVLRKISDARCFCKSLSALRLRRRPESRVHTSRCGGVAQGLCLPVCRFMRLHPGRSSRERGAPVGKDRTSKGRRRSVSAASKAIARIQAG